jgi:hypothetical protein
MSMVPAALRLFPILVMILGRAHLLPRQTHVGATLLHGREGCFNGAGEALQKSQVGIDRVLFVDVAPDPKHVGDHGEVSVEVRLRAGVRGARVRDDSGLELGRQSVEERVEIVSPRRDA